MTALVALSVSYALLGSAIGARAQTAAPGAPTTLSTTADHRMFAYYYLWWSAQHWHDLLGSSYPYSASPPPLPATLDSTGCHPRSQYAGNHLTDVYTDPWTQDDRSTIDRDVRQAVAAGLAGFAVNWAGTGATSQGIDSTPYSRRLDTLVQVVNQVRSEGKNFSLWISYKSSASMLTSNAIVNDLDYLAQRYSGNPAFDRSNGNRITAILMGSRKYSLSSLAAISTGSRSRFYLVGDESWDSWTSSRAAYLDADQYYWSSQSPYTNASSFDQMAQLAQKVRASAHNPDGTAKQWFAPLAPGYDKQLAGGSTCVPRKSGQTMSLLHSGNARSQPSAWLVISWNEITEGTYILPLRRYGTQPLNTLAKIIAGG